MDSWACRLSSTDRSRTGSSVQRFLTYHEHHGDRALARELYESLPPEARDLSGADLEAARAACPNRLDFARLLPRVERHLA
jgi:hypothetical protein